MSTTIKRSVVWLDLEEKPKRPKRSSQRLSKSSQSTSQAPSSPGPWIDLASVASSNGEDHESIHSADYSFDSISVYTPSTTWEYAAGYEKGALAYGHYAGSQTLAGKAMSVVSTESNIVYPNTFRLILITISLSLSLFLIALDRTIVATAIPQITNDFNALADVGWYGSAYLLTTTALQPTWGKLYVIFNLKRVFIFIMLLFMLGSLVCALAPNSSVFILGRAIAGFGAGGQFAGGLTIIAYSVPLHRRPTFVGGLTSLYGIASFVGPVLGGVLTDTIGWRWCFWINLPLGAITVAGIALVMKTPGNLENTKTWKEKLQEIDYIGPLLFMPASTCLLLALQWGGAVYAWNSPAIIGLFCASGALIPIWIWSQIKQGERATIPIRLITQRTVLFSSVYSAFFGAFQVLCYYIPLYFQAVKGSTATESGIQSLPLILAATVAAIIGGILLSIIGYVPPFMIGGTVIMTVGVGLLSTFDVNTSSAIWIGYQIIAGIGSGLNLQTPLLAVQTVVRTRDIPIATSVPLFFQLLGCSIQVAIAQAVLLAKLIPQIQSIAPSLTERQIIEAGATGLKFLVTAEQLPAVLKAYAKSVDIVFLVSAAMTALAVLAALPIEWRSVKKDKGKTKNTVAVA